MASALILLERRKVCQCTLCIRWASTFCDVIKINVLLTQGKICLGMPFYKYCCEKFRNLSSCICLIFFQSNSRHLKIFNKLTSASSFKNTTSQIILFVIFWYQRNEESKVLSNWQLLNFVLDWFFLSNCNKLSQNFTTDWFIQLLFSIGLVFNLFNISFLST